MLTEVVGSFICLYRDPKSVRKGLEKKKSEVRASVEEVGHGLYAGTQPCSREGRHSHSEGRRSCALHTRVYVSVNGLCARCRADELQEEAARKNIRRWKIPRCHTYAG